jgi:hypothetical protein
LRAVPPPYPPNAPVPRIKRWQGIRYEIGFRATAFVTDARPWLAEALGHVFVGNEGARRDAQQRLPYAHLIVRPLDQKMQRA